jgi:Uma2 family endonuclease
MLLQRRQFSLEQYHQMITTGVISEGERVELIDGEILEMAAIGSKHSAQVNRLNRLFSRSFGDDVLVSVQNPLELGPRSEPEPDVVLLRWRADYYEASHPQPSDVYLVIEVADSTVEFDRNVKALAYARGGIGEYWLVNLGTDAIEVYGQPTSQGYQCVETKYRAESIMVAALSDGLGSTAGHRAFTVDQLLG